MNKKILKKLDNLIEKYVSVASASRTTQILTQTFAYYGDQTEDGIQNVRDVSRAKKRRIWFPSLLQK